MIILNVSIFVSDLVSGLLCCSLPSQYTLGVGDIAVDAAGPEMEWQQSPPGSGSGATKEDRTRDWVAASRLMMLEEGRARCRQGQCGQDCGVGFCTNVWRAAPGGAAGPTTVMTDVVQI